MHTFLIICLFLCLVPIAACALIVAVVLLFPGRPLSPEGREAVERVMREIG